MCSVENLCGNTGVYLSVKLNENVRYNLNKKGKKMGFKIIRNYHTHFKGDISEHERVQDKQFMGFAWCRFGVLTVLLFIPYLCYVT